MTILFIIGGEFLGKDGDKWTNRMNSGPERKPEEKDSIMSKIQQLGETAVPQLSQDTNIHCLTIIGQIEGHMHAATK